jgi:Recombinase zinc beta ribbon domain
MRGRKSSYTRYYTCRNHDPVRARGEHRRCPGRNIRADALDTFVFEQLRAVLQDPELLLAGERAVVARTPEADDELLRAQLKRLERRVEAASSERRRLVDLYQSGLLELAEVQGRAKEIDARRDALEQQRHALIEQRSTLAAERASPPNSWLRTPSPRSIKRSRLRAASEASPARGRRGACRRLPGRYPSADPTRPIPGCYSTPFVSPVSR